jgi:hypothetical protein
MSCFDAAVTVGLHELFLIWAALVVFDFDRKVGGNSCMRVGLHMTGGMLYVLLK